MLFEILGGVLLTVGYGAYRALSSDGWDDSNLLNWLRLLSHVYMHPEDFGQMYYLNDEMLDELLTQGFDPGRPFDYISKDEFSENFPMSRPGRLS